MAVGTLVRYYDPDLQRFVPVSLGNPLPIRLEGVVLTQEQLDALATDIEVAALLIDEDDMASNLATKAPTQQSTKAYVDAEVAGAVVEPVLAGAGGAETATVDSANGALGSGYVRADATSTAGFDVSGDGAQGFGYSYADNGAGSTIIASANGGIASGFSKGYGGTAISNIQTAGQGGFSHGYSHGYNGTAEILASGNGSIALGWAMGYNGDARVKALSLGTFSFGYSYSSGAGSVVEITASARGAFAGGNAKATGGADASITASASGSFAFGSVAAAQTIVASAVNAVQFGPGTNTLADSLRVGTGVRLKGTVGAPAAPANGDIWQDASGSVNIQSGGVTVQIS